MTAAAHTHRRWRSITAGLLGIVAMVLVFAGGLAVLGSRAVFDADFFADHIAASLSDQRVASYVADHVTDAVIAGSEDLMTVRPLLKITAEAVVTSPPFRSVVRAAARRSHQLLVTRSGHDILLSVSDVGVILRQALSANPELAERIPTDAVAVFGALEQGPVMDVSGELLNIGQRSGRRGHLAFWSGMVLLTVSILLANRRETALLRAGVALLILTAVVLGIIEAGQLVVADLPSDPALGQALAGVWETFGGGLWPRVLVLGALGMLLAAAGTAFLEVMQLVAIKQRLQAVIVAETRHRGLRLLRGAVLIAVGWVAIWHPLLTARILVIAAGAVVAFIGLRELCRLAVDPAARLARKVEQLETEAGQTRTWGRVLLSLVGLLVIVGAAFVVIRGSESPVTGPAGRHCNGQAGLCDRPLNEVVFACAHNAMAGADVSGWMFPNQQVGVHRQLQDGIRALMLDVIPGIPMEDAVKTDLDEAEIVREKLEPSLGAEGFDAALRIRSRLIGGDEKDRELFLCHALCELGAIGLVPVLRDIHEFLILNPREVLIIIVEDAVPAVELAEAFTESRLDELVYRGPVTPPWPTLGEMVGRGERVLVLAENDSEGVPWIHPAWEVVQETPYHFTSPDSLSNGPNRGGTAGSLMLMNHWITSLPAPLPSQARVINTREVITGRAAAIVRERGMLPNLVAVDFYQTGDLIEVVRELNEAADGQR